MLNDNSETLDRSVLQMDDLENQDLKEQVINKQALQNLKNIIKKIVLCIVVILLLGLNLNNFLNLKTQFNTVSVRIHDVGITRNQLDDFIEYEQQNNKSNFAEINSFSIAERQFVYESEFNRRKSVTMYRVYGFMEQVLPMKLIQGNLPSMEDTFGCVIDVETALSLYGNVNVLGLPIKWEDKTYYIRGIVSNTFPLLMIQSSKEGDIFWNLELKYKEQDNARELTNQFMSRFSTDYTIVEGNYIVHLIGNIVGLPYLLLLIFGINYGMKIFKKLRGVFSLKEIISKNVLKYLSICISYFIALFCLLFYYAQTYVYIPRRIIPTRWSDFNHWVTIINDFKLHYNEIVSIMPIKKDTVLLEGVTLNIGISIFGVMFLLIIYFAYRGKDKMEV